MGNYKVSMGSFWKIDAQEAWSLGTLLAEIPETFEKETKTAQFRFPSKNNSIILIFHGIIEPNPMLRLT